MYGPEILPEEILYDPVTDKLGTGTYGTVYKGRCRGVEVAVKIPNKQNLSPEELAMFREEVKNMSKNSHPNIIRLMGACTEVGKLQIVTERCATDLERLLADGAYEFHQIMRLARDMAKGMVWLHYSNPPTIHRDLKPANILVDSHDQVKISDFGLAQVKSHSSIRDKPRGSLIWMAPEVILSKPFNEKIDVYSFGIILWQMATRKQPYHHLTTMKGFIDAICFNHERPPLEEVPMPSSLKSLMAKCWASNPSDRYEFYEIIFRLNEIITDAVIQDSHASMFWKKKFLVTGHQELQEQVEWIKFQSMLADELQIPKEKLSKLGSLMPQREIVQGNEVLQVSMARFYQFVQWFGPFYDHVQGKAIIEEMIDVQEQLWFHGFISRDVANSRLAGRERKTFLVRLSSTEPTQFPFSISFPNNEHERIERVREGEDKGGLKDSRGNVYRTISEFVAAHPKTLKIACPKSDDDSCRYMPHMSGHGLPSKHTPPQPVNIVSATNIRFQTLSLHDPNSEHSTTEPAVNSNNNNNKFSESSPEANNSNNSNYKVSESRSRSNSKTTKHHSEPTSKNSEPTSKHTEPNSKHSEPNSKHSEPKHNSEHKRNSEHSAKSHKANKEAKK